MLIEADLEDAGIKAKVNFAKEDLEVEKDDPKKIKEVVENLGYSLQEQ